MSFKDCIQRNLTGTLKPKQIESLIKEYDELVEKYTASMKDPSAADIAAQKVIAVKQAHIVDENKANIKHAVYQARLTADINKRMAERERQYNSMNKAQQAVERAPSIHHIIGDTYQSIDTRTRTIARTSTIKLVDFYNEHGSKMLGLSQKTEQLPNIIRSMLGEAVDNKQASLFGSKVKEVFDDLHARFRAAGGSIGKITNYFPQVHNPVKLKQSNMDVWINDLLPMLDREKMIDLDTGLPMSDEKLLAQMKGDYTAITTNGLSDLVERMNAGLVTKGVGVDVFKRKQQARFYQFKSADDFLMYNAKYGVGNEGLFDAIGGHIQSMARDIALMEKLGPRPNAMSRYFSVLMESKGVGQNGRNFVNGMYNVASGRLSDYGTLPLLYRFVEGTKALGRFMLGAATISALSDTVFIRTALKMKGIKQAKAMQNYFNGLNPTSKVNQRSMQRFTSVIEGLKGMTLEGARYTDSLGYDGGKIVQGIGFTSSMIIRASGLSRLTDQGKMVTMAATMGEFAEHAINRTPYGKLNPEFRATLNEFNISPSDYSVITKATPFSADGIDGLFITGSDVLEVDGVDMADKLRIAANYDDMITAIGELAVNNPTLRTRAITTGAALAPDSAKTGSTIRAVIGALMTFKGFPITVSTNFILPIARKAMSGKRSDIMGAIEVLGYTTVLGALSYQAKTLMRGEEARDMQDPKFWMAAAMQGGGAGIFGDFLFADYSRFNQSFAETLAGPVVGMYGDALRIINGNYNRALDEGTESKFFADAWRFSNKYIPGATLWYARLPLERAFIDGVTSVLDEDFEKKIASKERQLMNKEDRGYWWRPNSGLAGAFE